MYPGFETQNRDISGLKKGLMSPIFLKQSTFHNNNELYFCAISHERNYEHKCSVKQSTFPNNNELYFCAISHEIMNIDFL